MLKFLIILLIFPKVQNWVAETFLSNITRPNLEYLTDVIVNITNFSFKSPIFVISDRTCTDLLQSFIRKSKYETLFNGNTGADTKRPSNYLIFGHNEETVTNNLNFLYKLNDWNSTARILIIQFSVNPTPGSDRMTALIQDIWDTAINHNFLIVSIFNASIHLTYAPLDVNKSSCARSDINPITLEYFSKDLINIPEYFETFNTTEYDLCEYKVLSSKCFPYLLNENLTHGVDFVRKFIHALSRVSKLNLTIDNDLTDIDVFNDGSTHWLDQTFVGLYSIVYFACTNFHTKSFLNDEYDFVQFAFGDAWKWFVPRIPPVEMCTLIFDHSSKLKFVFMLMVFVGCTWAVIVYLRIWIVSKHVCFICLEVAVQSKYYDLYEL